MIYNQYITIDLWKLGYLRFWDGVTVVNANLLVFLKVYREIFDIEASIMTRGLDPRLRLSR